MDYNPDNGILAMATQLRERSTKNGTTSHSRMRSKYEKKAGFARKQVGGSVQDARDNYEGEASGIHPRIVRSTKY